MTERREHVNCQSFDSRMRIGRYIYRDREDYTTRRSGFTYRRLHTWGAADVKSTSSRLHCVTPGSRQSPGSYPGNDGPSGRSDCSSGLDSPGFFSKRVYIFGQSRSTEDVIDPTILRNAIKVLFSRFKPVSVL